jgi:hypothetical protein
MVFIEALTPNFRVVFIIPGSDPKKKPLPYIYCLINLYLIQNCPFFGIVKQLKE